LTKPLTAAAVQKYAPHPGERRIIRDAGARSLFLVITPSGHKSWLMRFRTTGGRIGKLVLGPVDLSGRELTGDPAVGQPLTLAAARQLAAEVLRQRALGHDPVADHKARKLRQRTAVQEAASNTFGGAAQDFITKYSRQRVRRWKEQARLLGLQPTAEGLEIIPGGLAQRWADKPLTQIDGHDIHQLVAETHERGAPGLERRSDGPTETRARAMLSCLSRMFRWLVQHRRVETNPCAGVHRPEASKARERVLSNDEIKAFWLATDTLAKPKEVDAKPPPFGAVLRLLLLTGCRLNEIAALRWEELGADATQINLPGARTKNHRSHLVPLAPLAQSIIAAIPRIADSPYVFTTNGKAPVAIGSKIKNKLDAEMNIPAWRIHDLRRTAITGMAELGLRPDVIELCVNHVSGTRGGIAGVYNRSELLPERRNALERWAVQVQGIVSGKPAKVVQLRKRGGTR
jgi:integrase